MTVKVALLVTFTATGCGCALIVGGMFTVSATAELVIEPPTLVSTTE